MGFVKDKRRYQWVAGGPNPCVSCGSDMHNIQNTSKIVDGRVKYHAKGFCKPCYSKMRIDNPNPVGLVSVGDSHVCSKCLEELPEEEFYLKESGRSGWCRVCHKLYKFNITRRDYDEMLEEQNGGCAICGNAMGNTGRLLCVDHDHACCSGSTSCGYCIRGLLCDMCNGGLGFFRDSTSNLKEAIEYLERRKNVESDD